MSGKTTLWERLTSFENLYTAAKRAQRGKRFKPAVGRFHFDLASSLIELRDELLSGTYEPGPYHTFTIYEPARRFISAAPYRDRVVHHALCQIIEPLFERSFIYDSYANRIGKGTHRALDRCTEYCRKYRYVFQGDVRLFFPSIDHQILLERLARRVFDPRVMALAETIVAHSNPQPAAIYYFEGDNLFTPYERRRGLPIGNLTSQFWANVYLDPFDHHFRDELAAPGYIRYVDDFLVFSNDKTQLAGWRDEAATRLGRLRLLLNERKSRIYPVEEGVPFLGFHVFPHHRRLLPASVTRARRRLNRLADDYSAGQVGMDEVRRSVAAWIAHAEHGNTRGLRRRLFNAVAFSGQRSTVCCGAARSTTIRTTPPAPTATTTTRRIATTTSGFVAP